MRNWLVAASAAVLIPVSASAVTAPSLAAVTVHVGDGTMNGAVIKGYDNVWLVTVRYNDGRVDERGLSSDHVRFRTIDGKRWLTRTEGTTSVTGKPNAAATSDFSMTFNVFDPITMAPKAGEAYSSDGSAQIRSFEGRHIETRTRPAKGVPENVVRSDSGEPVFDVHGGMTGLLLAALPLKTGYEAVLPGIGDEGIDTTTVRVVGEQTISGGRLGKLKTWVVEIGPSPSRSTYWISKSAPYVIRATVTAPNATASWDMLD